MASPVNPGSTVTNRVWRASSAETIDEDLAALWREVAREAPVSRAVMSNLVVFRPRAADDHVEMTAALEGTPIDDVARIHPARVIVLHHCHESNASATAEAAIAAQVGVLTFGSEDARYGIEQIVIESACVEAALPSLVRTLMLGDVPTSIWWTGDLLDEIPLSPIVTIGRQLLYDSREWQDVRRGVRALAPLVADRFGPDLADINWRRLLPVRRALAHAAGSSERAKRPGGASVQIRHRRDEAALAWLLAGWLEDVAAEVEPDTEPGEDVLSVVCGDGLVLRLGLHQVRVDDPLGPAPFIVPVARETAAEAVASELCALTHDASLHCAMTALIERFRIG
jgi:glucose-6-phosphate dehydrogenase assembly protein OpcA